MNIHTELRRLELKYGNNPDTVQVYQDTVKVLLAFTEGLKKDLEGLSKSCKSTERVKKLSNEIAEDHSGLARYLVDTVSKCLLTSESPEETAEACEYLVKYLRIKFDLPTAHCYLPV